MILISLCLRVSFVIFLDDYAFEFVFASCLFPSLHSCNTFVYPVLSFTQSEQETGRNLAHFDFDKMTKMPSIANLLFKISPKPLSIFIKIFYIYCFVTKDWIQTDY